ncbi:Ferritin [Candidatus Zixiibacteriota bacterium]|nr:Ferritin [candidate division Zixibacteria bacterium]
MISSKMEQALNGQIKEEYFSSYLYLAMSAHFKAANLDGFAHWMRIQSQEEMTHALKIFDYVNEQQGKVTLENIDKPQSEWGTPLSIFEAAYKHEQKITGLIGRLADLAIAEKDHATAGFLQWFVKEQVEEEATAADIVHKLKMVGDSNQGLFMVDRYLGERK